jgi:hypothetical protein
MNIKSLGVILAILFLSSNAYAAGCEKTEQWIDDKVSSDSYLTRTSGMLMEGVNRVLTAPVEAYHATYNTIKESENPIYGSIEGIMRGAYTAGEEVVKGVLDFGLAIIPEFRGVDGNA